MHFIISILLLLLFINPVFACDIIDDAGNRIQLTHPAKRVVSLSPDLTEIVFSIGAGSHIVGVVSGSDYPPLAKKIPIVASYNSIEIEKIAILHPDLILAWTETKYIAQLKKLGIPVYLSHPNRLTDVAMTMQKLGCLLGAAKTANALAEQYLQHYHTLQMRNAHQKKLTVFYELWPKPLITITKNSWINEIISICGGENIFANLHGAAPEIDIEAVITANPDIIIGTTKDGLQQWQAWTELKAIHNQNTYCIHPDLIERAGPRLLDGVEEVCRFVSIARKRDH
jgi:iron complex transport system substrate-binding protein